MQDAHGVGILEPMDGSLWNWTWKHLIVYISVRPTVIICELCNGLYRLWINLLQPKGIRIRSAVFPQYTGQTHRPTDVHGNV